MGDAEYVPGSRIHERWPIGGPFQCTQVLRQNAPLRRRLVETRPSMTGRPLSIRRAYIYGNILPLLVVATRTFHRASASVGWSWPAHFAHDVLRQMPRGQAVTGRDVTHDYGPTAGPLRNAYTTGFYCLLGDADGIPKVFICIMTARRSLARPDAPMVIRDETPLGETGWQRHDRLICQLSSRFQRIKELEWTCSYHRDQPLYHRESDTNSGGMPWAGDANRFLPRCAGKVIPVGTS